VGPKGGQPAGPTLQPLERWLHDDTLQEAVEGNPKLKVGGGQIPWPANHVARPSGQVSNPSLDPYKYPPTGGNQSTTLIL
jgi:hypothetical protein